MINGLRVAAVMPLHFGVDYLPYAIQSVAAVVDEFLIMYSPVPNHGTYSSPLRNPETRDQLMEAAYSVAPDKTRWLEWDGWRSEGEQFKAGWDYTNAEVIVKLDCDECWFPGLLESIVCHAVPLQQHETRIALRHYWRSFRKAFTHDPAAPGRVYLRHMSGGAGTYHASPAQDDSVFRLHHFGYALPVDVTRYKMSIHGHAHQFRQDCDWFNDVFLANRQYDCHPVGSEYWNTETVDVPEFLRDHPFANLEVIEDGA